MSTFEDIESRMAQLRAEAERREQHEKEQKERLEQQLAERAIIRSNIRELTSEAVELLQQREVPTEPVWNHVAIGRGVPKQSASMSGSSNRVADPIRELQQTSEGWYILRQNHRVEYGAEPEIVKYCLTTDAEVQLFARTQISNYRKNTRSQAKDTRGIIFTSDVNLDSLNRILLQTDIFKNGVASLIAGLGPYEDVM